MYMSKSVFWCPVTFNFKKMFISKPKRRLLTFNVNMQSVPQTKICVGHEKLEPSTRGFL